jgi:hypothetical protein
MVSDLKLILVFAILGLVSLQQQLSIFSGSFNWSNDIENHGHSLYNVYNNM